MQGFTLFFESEEEDYRGEHSAPRKGSGAPLHDLTQVYPDIYELPLATAARYYGHGEPHDAEALSIMQRAKGRPSMPVKIYRAVPDLNKEIDKKIKALTMNAGDWVTTVRNYAATHGRSVLLGNYKIVSKTVKAKDLYTDGNSPYEFGYDP